MNARDFLRAVAAVAPAVTPSRAGMLSALAPRLQADFRPDQLTAEVADAVAAALRGVPTYPELAQAVRSAAGSSARPTPKTEDEAWGERWERFIRMRLGEGGDRAHLLSLLRAYCPASQLDCVMARVFPREHAEERAVENDRRATKAAAVARALAAHKAPPKVPASAEAPPPEPKRPEPKHVPRSMVEEARAILAAKAGAA